MDREDYITNIHAYWRQSQKATLSTKKAASTATSLPPKIQQSKLSAVYSNPSVQPHDGCDQYGNYFDYQNDDGDDNDDDEYENPRYKGKNRQTQNQWDDECHKDKRRKGKNCADDQWYDSEDYYDYNDDYYYHNDYDDGF